MAPPVSPAPSTLNSPRESSPFLFAAYHPADTAEEVTEVAPAQSAPTGTVATPTAPAPVTATPINRAPVTATVSNINSAAMAKPASAVPSSPASAPSTMSTANPIPAHAVSVGGRAIVLGYHQFTGPGVPSKNIYSMSQDVFESEMKYLHDNGYTVVPLSDVVRFVKHEIGLPPNAVAITIDDGYKSALNYAAPVLKQYNYPWTFFVYPEFITRTEGKGAASWPDLVELGKEGVDVECHSMTHPILTSHTQKFKGSRHVLTPEEYDEFLTNETSGAKAILEHELGKTIRYFAYPYGAYNKTVQDKVVAAGFDAVFTVADNPVHITTDVDSIGRYIITKPVERAFAGYLRQGALGLAEVDPAPGATTSNPRPVISAVLGFIGDPASLETDVRDYGIVRHDFDPQTSTVRMYLPRDLIQPEVLVSIRAKDAQSGQIMVANWHFNYEPAAGAPAATHEPIPVAPEPKGETSETNAPSAPPTAMAAPVSASVNKPAPGPSSKGTTP